MKNAVNIVLLALCLCAFSVKAQLVIDTVCVGHGPSNLAVPYQAGYNYSWQVNGGTILSPNDSNDVLVDWTGTPGYYQITVVGTNSNGCGDTSKASIYLVSPTIATISGPTEVCQGSPVVLLSNILNGITWQGGKKDKEITFIANRDTTVYLITENSPCVPDTAYHFIKVVDAPQTSMNSLEDTLQVGTIKDLYYTGAPGVAIDWYLDEDWQGSGTYSRYYFNEEGNHVVTQVVSDGTCTDTLYRYIYVTKIFKLFIPTAFTPDGDGINDIFLFKGTGIAKFQATVYNRWGEVVYSWNENSQTEGWDGSIFGNPAPNGIYTYKIYVTDIGGTQVEEQGTFNLLR